MSHQNNRVPACGHLYQNRKCRLCMVYAGKQMRAWRMQGYAANKLGKPITAWPHTGDRHSKNWYPRKNAWQDGWQAAENRPELPIAEWLLKHDPANKPAKPRKEHRIEDWMKAHGLEY